MRILITNQNKDLLPLDKTFEYGAIDTETDGLTPHHGSRIIGISLYFPEIDTSYYISIRHPESDLDPIWYRYTLLERLPHMARTWVLFNSKFDMHMLHVDGMQDFTRIEDVMVAAQLLNENEELTNGGRAGAYALKRLARKYLGNYAVADENKLFELAKARGLNAKSEMWKLPAIEVADYAMGDVEITWGLRQRFMPGLIKWQQDKLYFRRNEFVLKALFRMERNGVLIHVPTIYEHKAKIQPAIAGIKEEFNGYLIKQGLKLDNTKSEDYINLNSPKQVKEFFNWMGREIDGTNALILNALAQQGDKWASKLLEYRRLTKLDSTYYTPYLSYVDDNSIIHTTYNAIGAETGRLSSLDPNLQNIPRGDKSEIKQVFIPRPGKTMVGTDYKAMELRLGAYFADEPRMVAVFRADGDPHTMTANALNIPRSLAKTFNFGLIYGMGWRKAQLMYGLGTEANARKLVEGWHKEYPAFRNAVTFYQNDANIPRGPDGFAGDFKYIRLHNGRTRKYQELLKFGYDYTKDAFNFLVQGTGAAVAEESVLRVMETFSNDILQPIMVTHDSLTYEIDDSLVDEIVPQVNEIMTNRDFSVPLLVETGMTKASYYEL